LKLESRVSMLNFELAERLANDALRLFGNLVESVVGEIERVQPVDRLGRYHTAISLVDSFVLNMSDRCRSVPSIPYDRFRPIATLKILVASKRLRSRQTVT
jgi:hypothetical protein